MKDWREQKSDNEQMVTLVLAVTGLVLAMTVVITIAVLLME